MFVDFPKRLFHLEPPPEYDRNVVLLHHLLLVIGHIFYIQSYLAGILSSAALKES